ncbi:MAG: shikimate kinase [Clostridia bacterium]|nr:shikimate kinase [Clostridia bacterium]
MKNIVLIGMPGAGKSTIGVLLAKSLLCSFTDTDLIIQNTCRKSLCDIIEEKGTDGFLQVENDIICACEFKNSVVATGGSAVYGKEAMEKLKKNGIFVYLKITLAEIEKRLADIKTRGVAMKNGETVAQLFEERTPLYESLADITLDCTGLTPERCVDSIVAMLI